MSSKAVSSRGVGFPPESDNEFTIGAAADDLAADFDQTRSNDLLGSVSGDENVDHGVVAESVQSPPDELRTGIGPLPPSVRRGDSREDFRGSIDDGFNAQPLGEFLAYHNDLLRLGWRPTRWRHPVKGDLELVTSDGFWIARMPNGQMFHHFGLDRSVAALRSGRSDFSRDEQGNLVLVEPPGGPAKVRRFIRDENGDLVEVFPDGPATEGGGEGSHGG